MLLTVMKRLVFTSVKRARRLHTGHTVFLFAFVVVQTLTPSAVGMGLFSASRHGPTCGRQHIRTSKVVGGNETLQGEFPWTVSIRRFNHHHCGGVIIAQRWILTAAHCIQSRAPDQLSVRIGEHDLMKHDHIAQDYQVDRIIIHSNYTQITGFKNPVSLNNSDIALLKLKRDIRWSEYAWPVCLGTRDADSVPDAVVVGWGKKTEKSDQYSEKLQKVRLTIVANDVCTKWYRLAGKEMTINDRIICAGYKTGGRDACHGDSGGENSTPTQFDEYHYIETCFALYRTTFNENTRPLSCYWNCEHGNRMRPTAASGFVLQSLVVHCVDKQKRQSTLIIIITL